MINHEWQNKLKDQEQEAKKLDELAKNIYKSLDGLTFWQTKTVIELTNKLLEHAKNDQTVKSSYVPEI